MFIKLLVFLANCPYREECITVSRTVSHNYEHTLTYYFKTNATFLIIETCFYQMNFSKFGYFVYLKMCFITM